MARMHSRKKGKSQSTKPSQAKEPVWLRYSKKEIELLVVKLAKEGIPPSKIGLILRDTYGIPDVRVILNKKITQILEEKGLAPKIPEDLANLIRKALKIRAHMAKNKKDMTAKRGLILTESKIHRLVKYYKRVGKLPQDWRYDPETARLYV